MVRSQILANNRTAQLTVESIHEICGRPTVALASAGEIDPIRGDVSKRRAHKSSFFSGKQCVDVLWLPPDREKAIVSHELSSSVIFVHIFSTHWRSLASCNTRRRSTTHGAVRCLALRCGARYGVNAA